MYLEASHLKVEARALDGIGTNLAVGNSHVLRMNGIAFEGFFALQRAVEHHVGILREPFLQVLPNQL